ncbi:MAG: OmpA family protein [Crocinitomicaceae bacterium]|nr:OmpA family protein [Crocinitomicaceae bacterium]
MKYFYNWTFTQNEFHTRHLDIFKMKHLLVSIFIVFSLTSFGQVKQKVADNLFKRMEYYQCVQMYEELSKKTINGKGKENLENVRKAAMSNYELFRMEKAIKYFNFLDAKSNLSEDDRAYFIQALRFIGKYDVAEKQVGIAESLYPNNTYFSKLKTELKEFNKFFADSSNISIKKTNISSIYGDFAPVFYQNGLIYATKSKNTEVLNGRYKWDNSFYVSMLQSKFQADSTIGNGKLLRHQFLDKAHDGPVAFTRDEQKMVVTKNKFGKRKGKDVVVLALYFSELKDGKWTKLIPFEYNDNAYNVGHGCFSDDGNTLYFVSDMDGGQGMTDIYRSQLVGGKWSKPENLGVNVNTNMQEMFPFVVGDRLFFASNGHFGLGGLDIFEVDLKKNNTPRNLGYPINTSADDFGLVCVEESDGINGYFSTNRDKNIDGIYAFVKKDIQIELIVNVFEKYTTNESVAHHPVYLTNEATGEKEEYFTNNDGNVHLLIRKNETYKLSTKKDEFKLLKEVTITSDGVERDSVLKADLLLLPTKITIALRVISKDTKKPLEGAATTISHFSTNWDTLLVTNEHGLITLIVERNKNFWAHAAKKGYIDADKGFSTSNEDGKIIELELEMTPIKKGEKFKLENIFYDLNKATLRPESMSSLDKLAEFIIKNELKIELSSHTDSRGSDAYNMKLSQARAQSCVDYLLTKGVRAVQMKAKGYGETQLLNRCKNGVTCSEEEHQENRRTEVKILDY